MLHLHLELFGLENEEKVQEFAGGQDQLEVFSSGCSRFAHERLEESKLEGRIKLSFDSQSPRNTHPKDDGTHELRQDDGPEA